MNEFAFAVKNIRGNIGKPIHLHKPVGHIAQKHRHVVVGTRLRIAPRART